jgi:hypothetical protein
MSSPAAFCPQCRNEVVFLHEGTYMRCPACGFRFETGRAMAAATETPGAMTFLGALLRVFLIMVAIVVVAVGVLFLGCIAVMR